MSTLRIIGDVHGQIEPDDLLTAQARPYLELIAGAPYSIQVGDMGDGETYHQLVAHADPGRHRFLPGNHDHYNQLPPHSLGDFGAARWGGVDFFFVRGAESADRDKLVRLGRELGKTLWFEQEELTGDQMQAAKEQYLRAQPEIVLTHDAPTEIARFAWDHARRARPPVPGAVFRSSRTNAFLGWLLGHHAPRLWAFGHHHRDWRYREGRTLFVCVGELSYVDITPDGEVLGP
jgi:hypothetical protein